MTNDDKLDVLLLVGGEELQTLIQTLPEQPMDYKSHIEKLDTHFEANRNNTFWSCISCSIPNGHPTCTSLILRLNAGSRGFIVTSPLH